MNDWQKLAEHQKWVSSWHAALAELRDNELKSVGLPPFGGALSSGERMGFIDGLLGRNPFRPAVNPQEQSMSNAIDDYREAKRGMQSIIDRHMAEAFAEIKREYGATPVAVSLNVAARQEIQERYANGVYDGCSVQMDGE